MSITERFVSYNPGAGYEAWEAADDATTAIQKVIADAPWGTLYGDQTFILQAIEVSHGLSEYVVARAEVTVRGGQVVDVTIVVE